MMNDDNGQFTDEDRYEKGWWLNDESPLDNYLLKAEDNILIKESDLTFILTYNMIHFMVSWSPIWTLGSYVAIF